MSAQQQPRHQSVKSRPTLTPTGKCKRGKTPGKLWKVSPCCDSRHRNGGGFPPFRRLTLADAAPACPGFCPYYREILYSIEFILENRN